MPQGVPPGQQGEGQGLSLCLADAKFRQRPHDQAAAAALQLFYEQAVAAAPASHQQLDRLGPMAQILGDNRGTEAGQGG